ncbi:MAG: hypothetical protein A2V99_15315 [Spirochaetes bacterium RBG_16_67_19]|nr:MAG: hypothetical protein A2V99_15315 [Spirochaetes bacterium RBG_16_67_19]
MAATVRFFDRRKFMWDGEAYESVAAAEAKQKGYEAQGFETQRFEEEGQALVYTRRVVKEIVIEGGNPNAG